MNDADALRRGPVKKRAYARFVSNKQNFGVELLRRQQCPGNGLFRRVVAAHRIYRDACPHNVHGRPSFGTTPRILAYRQLLVPSLSRSRTPWYYRPAMAKRCEICDKGPKAGNNVSHAMNKTKRRWLPNLQSVRIDDRGVNRTARVCTSCLRSNRVKRRA